jgi:hypothetical protein
MRHVLFPLFALLALAACTGTGTPVVTGAPVTQSAPADGSFTKALLPVIAGPDNIHS